MAGTRTRSLTGNIVAYALLIVASLMVLVPVFWMISTALKTPEDTFATPPQWIPAHPTLEAFRNIWNDYPFGHYFANSLIVVFASTFISIIFSTLAGYGTSRFQFKGKGFYLTFLLVTQMFPAIMLLIPFYNIMTQVGLVNTLFGLVITYITFTIPVCSWMMLGYFDSISKEIDQAASIDGCGPFRTFWNIILPLILPGIVATAIYSFVMGWNEYMFAMILMSDENLKTVPVGVGQLVTQNKIEWNDMMAASLVATVPVSIIFIFLQKYMIKSLTAGSIK
ncbi:carbohydrate ABC transporter permease [Paenibacillus nasutitermitis]|uniref:ABC transporter permease n=1 Tax=Paenibacillus nasutitermitis TaxID=1652958 RepID=A0A917DX30_9BACL|nr:carbohydrate ABC transporter permease [Paenibacillus nasutitermitis]GGD76960.1 ABC transporter permease [Paenibacillus nasutitermitis]